MYGGRYGIWGIDPNGVDVMGRALQTASGLGALQTNALQNQGLGMQNEYYPQNQAIGLANAVLGQENLAHQQQRFGPGYVLAKMINTLPSKVKMGLAAENPALYSTAVQMANDDYVNGSQASGPSMGMNILQPYIDRQNGLGQNAQQPPMPQSYSMGQNAQQPQSAQPSYGMGKNNSPQNAQPNTLGSPSPTAAPAPTTAQPSIQDTVQKYGKQEVDKALRNTDQQRRVDAGKRYDSPIDQVNQRIPLVMKYTGILGKALLGKDKIASSLGADIPSYKAYEELKNLMPLAEGELGPLLAKRSTDKAAQEVKDILNYDSFFSNPDISMSKWNSAMKTIDEVRKINEKTTSDQLKTKDRSSVIDNGEKSSKIAESKTGWSGDKYTHSDGKSYTLAELQKIAKGGK